jgi:hypothetical protein
MMRSYSPQSLPSFPTNALGVLEYNGRMPGAASVTPHILQYFESNSRRSYDRNPLTVDEMGDVAASVRDLREGRFIVLDGSLSDAEFLARVEGQDEGE